MAMRKLALGLAFVPAAVVGLAGAIRPAEAAPKTVPADTCTVCGGIIDLLTGTIMVVCKTGANNCNGKLTCVALLTQTKSGALSVDIGCEIRS